MYVCRTGVQSLKWNLSNLTNNNQPNTFIPYIFYADIRIKYNINDDDDKLKNRRNKYTFELFELILPNAVVHICFGGPLQYFYYYYFRPYVCTVTCLYLYEVYVFEILMLRFVSPQKVVHGVYSTAYPYRLYEVVVLYVEQKLWNIWSVGTYIDAGSGSEWYVLNDCIYCTGGCTWCSILWMKTEEIHIYRSNVWILSKFCRTWME